MKDGRGLVGVEAALAFAVGTVWFALSGALLHLLPSLFVLVLAVNLLGDAARDRLDPAQRAAVTRRRVLRRAGPAEVTA